MPGLTNAESQATGNNWNFGVNDSWAAFARLGYRFNPNWRVELEGGSGELTDRVVVVAVVHGRRHRFVDEVPALIAQAEHIEKHLGHRRRALALGERPDHRVERFGHAQGGEQLRRGHSIGQDVLPNPRPPRPFPLCGKRVEPPQRAPVPAHGAIVDTRPDGLDPGKRRFGPDFAQPHRARCLAA